MEKRLSILQHKSVSKKNKDRSVEAHFPYGDYSEFTMGFLEACDFFQYITSFFSIATAHELWPPRSDWDREQAIQNGVLAYNHFWKKFTDNNRSPNAFYQSLDYQCRSTLYSWYKRNVTK